jgi:hypothetical protein
MVEDETGGLLKFEQAQNKQAMQSYTSDVRAPGTYQETTK